MSAAAPPDPRTSPWLGLSSSLGRIAAWFLIGSCVLALFAPLAFLLDIASSIHPQDPGAPLVLLFSDPAHLLEIADLLALVGTGILAAAVFLVLLGLARGERRTPLEAYALGVAAFACLVAWGPTMLASGGLVRAPATDVEAAAVTGGWSLAALLLLAGSLAYLFLGLRLERGRARGVAAFRWPVFAAVNLLGSAVIAAFFEAAAGGARDPRAFSFGLAIKVVLVPILGVWAYADLRDRFPAWGRLAVRAAPIVAAPAPVTPPKGRFADADPPPPPPVGQLVRPLPPPPEDAEPAAEDRGEVGGP